MAMTEIYIVFPIPGLFDSGRGGSDYVRLGLSGVNQPSTAEQLMIAIGKDLKK